MSNKIYVRSAGDRNNETADQSTPRPTFSVLADNMQELTSELHRIANQLEAQIETLGIGPLPDKDPNEKEANPGNSILDRLLFCNSAIAHCCSRLNQVAERIAATL